MRGERPGTATHQITVRVPDAVWADLRHELTQDGNGTMNDLVLRLLQAELARRRRAAVLMMLAEQRAEILRQGRAAEDSTPYIRRLREGDRADD